MAEADQNPPRALPVVLLLVLLVLSALYLLRPISDSDLFWHLKTGEWIYEHQSLPSSDPFAYTTPDPPSRVVRFILTSYWLSQLGFHAAFSAGGMKGIVLLRAGLLASLAFVLLRRMRGDLLLSSSLLLVAAVSFLEVYSLERPHAFSGGRRRKLAIAILVPVAVASTMASGLVGLAKRDLRPVSRYPESRNAERAPSGRRRPGLSYGRGVVGAWTEANP
jgi:hypothetical protein